MLNGLETRLDKLVENIENLIMECDDAMDLEGAIADLKIAREKAITAYCAAKTESDIRKKQWEEALVRIQLRTYEEDRKKRAETEKAVCNS